MFDKLRDSLNRFRDDVEESAEEAPPDEADGETDPPQEADAGATTADADDEGTADPNRDGDGEGHGDTDDQQPGFRQRAASFARGQLIIDEDDLEDPLWELEMALLENDVEMGVAEALLDRIEDELVGESRKITTSTTSVVEDALGEALLSVISVGQFDFEERIAEIEKPVVIIFTGVNGVGKTTSIAKVARYLEEQGYSSVLANGDTYRAGANEQIEEHADRLDKRLISHEQGGDPAAVIYDAVEYAEANDIDVVLGDTAGRLHTSDDLMSQLEKIGRVVDPDLTIFVDEAVAGQDAVQRARTFNDAVEIDGAILTKADADASGGAAISIAHVTGKPILFLGTGQGYDDLKRFDPEALVDRLLGGE
ncbi:MAG: signal recognition particle-docking protein FtsY [Halobacteriales archaeon]|nr:signal recognition particle-docking protein FtsY [Halobacteriales archaeon]